jgi:hypothetical protein
MAHDSGFDLLAEKVASAYALPGARLFLQLEGEAESEISNDDTWQGARALAHQLQRARRVSAYAQSARQH